MCCKWDKKNQKFWGENADNCNWTTIKKKESKIQHTKRDSNLPLFINGDGPLFLQKNQTENWNTCENCKLVGNKIHNRCSLYTSKK